MFEIQGYKKFEDETEIIGAYAIQTKRYQKRVDTLKSWEDVPVCKLNDKLFLNITETNVNTFPCSPKFSIELVHEGEDDVWVNLKIYSITQEQIENNLSKYEEKLKKMWIVFNEENSNIQVYKRGMKVRVLPGGSYSHCIGIGTIAEILDDEVHTDPEGHRSIRIRGQHRTWTPGVELEQLIDPAELEFIIEENELTDEEIQAIDNATMFHESIDWSIRFARNVLKASEEKKNG